MGRKKTTLRNSLRRTVTPRGSFRFPYRRVCPERGRCELRKTSGRVDNGGYCCGVDRRQIGQRDGGRIPCFRSLPPPAGGGAKTLPLLAPLTSASLSSAQDAQPPETRHLPPEGSRSPSNPEAVARKLPPTDREGKRRVNRKSGAGARPPHMRAHARREAPRCRRTMAELGEEDEAELQRLVAAEQQKAQFTAQVRGQGPGGERQEGEAQVEFSDSSQPVK